MVGFLNTSTHFLELDQRICVYSFIYSLSLACLTLTLERTGAGSPIIGESVDRIYGAFAEEETADLYASSISKSFVLSVDQAHAIHPNYRYVPDQIMMHIVLLNF